MRQSAKTPKDFEYWLRPVKAWKHKPALPKEEQKRLGERFLDWAVLGLSKVTKNFEYSYKTFTLDIPHITNREKYIRKCRQILLLATPKHRKIFITACKNVKASLHDTKPFSIGH